MLTVQKAVLQKAVVLLNSLGAEYVIQIQDQEPVIKGELLVKPKKKPKVKRKYEYGTFTKMYRELGVDKMSVSDVKAVPIGEFPKAKIQSSLSSFCTNIWGAGSAITSINKDDNTVEVIRVS